MAPKAKRAKVNPKLTEEEVAALEKARLERLRLKEIKDAAEEKKRKADLANFDMSKSAQETAELIDRHLSSHATPRHFDPAHILRRQSTGSSRVPKLNSSTLTGRGGGPAKASVRESTQIPDETTSTLTSNAYPSTASAEPPPLPSEVAVAHTHKQYNFSLTAVDPKAVRSIVKEATKTHVFRRIKFFNRYKHAEFDTAPTTLCGQIMKHCRITADASWWYEIRPCIIQTLTMQRNNVIKAIKNIFKGNFIHQHMPLLIRSNI